MSLIRRAAERAAGAMPAHHHASTLMGMASSTIRDADHPVAAVVVSGLGVAAILADSLYAAPEPPQGGYAGFTTDGEKPRRGWRR